MGSMPPYEGSVHVRRCARGMTWRSRVSRVRPGGKGPLTLHIGTPKSGTTYLQSRLRAVRGRLADQGWLYPGEHYLPDGGLNHQSAVYAMAGPEVGWATDEVKAQGSRHLKRLVAELRAHRGPALLSAEAMASFHDEAIRNLLAALPRPEGQVDVVVTARDAGRLLTSVWQQNVKNGATHDQGTYLSSVARMRGVGSSQFWTAYGLPELVDRWAGVVGLDRICLVTAPQDPRPGDDLWARFLRACGIEGLDDASEDATRRKDSNISLTASQAELLRQVNMILDAEGLDRRECRRLRSRLLTAWMSQGSGGARRLGLTPDWLPTLREWAAQDRSALAERCSGGMRLVGDLEDLVPTPRLVEAGSGELTLQDAARDLLAAARAPKS